VWSRLDRKPVRRTFRSLAEARAWPQESQAAIRWQMLRAPSSVTVRVVAVEWLAAAQAGQVRKCRTALSMVFDFAGVIPNPARDRRVKLPLEEPDEVQPPHADHVERVGWLLTVPYLIGLLALDSTGARVGEVAAAKVGDLDENRKAWLVRAAVSKTRRARWVELPADLLGVVVDGLPAREDRDPHAPLFPIGSADRLRMAIARACRDAGVPLFSPHDLRHRRISLLHHQGTSWAEIGAGVGQRNLSTTADIYTHVLMDYREIDRSRLLERVRAVHSSVHTQEQRDPAFAGTF
jgi:integrase